MKVILNTDVRDLGKVGEVLNVSAGYARNFLIPKRLASVATEKNVKELAHFKKVAEGKKAKLHKVKEDLAKKLSGHTIAVKRPAGDEDKLFGSVTNADISAELLTQGFDIDKKDIVLEEPIKLLGQHKATIKFGEGLKAELKISVDRA